MKKSRLVPVLVMAVIVVTALIVASTTARPADATPGQQSACSSCHSGTPSGTVTATPSKTDLTTGEAYTVTVDIGLSAAGHTGYWLSNDNAQTPTVSKYAGGPSSSQASFVVNMNAPATAGSYTYKVWGVKGPNDNTGMAKSTTYSITVTSGGADAIAPTTQALAKASVKRLKTATLKYQVDDATAGTDNETVTIKITNAKSKVVRTLKLGVKPANAAQKATFKCKLAKGKYTWTVYATDAAGNPQTSAGASTLKVK